MPTRPHSVDQYLKSGCGRCALGGTPRCKVHAWTAELRLLRKILSASALVEEIKWSVPCYTHEGKNVVMLSALKESVTVSFFQGAQLKDPASILEKPGRHSRFARYIRFTDIQSIASKESTILQYIREAIELTKSDNAKAPAAAGIPEYPDELSQILEEDPDFAAAFAALTPGRKRGYLIHFSSAKQSETRIRRIRASMAGIFNGKGWNER